MADEAKRETLRAVWQQLSAYNEWQLVSDEATFFARVDTIVATFQTTDTDPRKLARAALMRGYGELLYGELQARRERAATELWLAFRRLGLRRGQGNAAAEELAQETMRRVLEALPQLRSPQSLIFWAFRIFYTVARESGAASEQHAPSPLAQDDPPAIEVPDPGDMAAAVEQSIVDERLLALLNAKLPNELERLVLLRIIGLGEHPRDVARDLGLPLHRTRVAKSRALKRLREDAEVIQLLRELTGDPELERERGTSDDESEA